MRICGVLLAFAGVWLSIATGTAEARQFHIVALGDSNFGAPGVLRSEAYPAQLERALRARGIDAVVTNAGINGDTTAGVLARLDRSVPNGTDLVLLSVGVNDVVVHGKSREETRANVQAIAERLRARGLRVLVMPTGKQFQGALADDPKYHVEGLRGATGPTPGKTNWHLTAEGYAKLAEQTLPSVTAALPQ